MKKNLKCDFCNREFSSVPGAANHQIQCNENPDKIIRKTGTSWNKGLKKETDSRVMAGGLALKTTLIGKPNSGCCAWSKEERSTAAKAQGFGGYRENSGRSKKFKVLDSFGSYTTLQSTYELDCSEILMELGLRWKRPKSLKYSGKNYFADFYLPDFDLYLDTKNEYKARLDFDKIQSVKRENDVRLFILRKPDINVNYIASLTQW